MQERFTLRFESGDRAGETVPLPAAGGTVGRRPENALVIADASVSGRHAELVLEGDGLLVRDLGSTNGTRVGGERVTEARLAHGDRVIFGSVPLVLFDARLAEDEPAAAGAGASTAGEPVGRLAAPRAAGGRRSTILVVAALLLAAGGAAYWLLGSGSGGGSRVRQRPVEPVDGNLLAAGYSFEQPTTDWRTPEGATAFFERSAGARHGGTHGMRARVAAGERARLASPEVVAREGRTLRLAARLRSADAAAGRVGVELLGRAPADGGEPPTLVAFGPWIGDTPDHQAVELEVAIPAGFDRARVVAEALGEGVAREDGDGAGGGGGVVDLDDVSLVPGGAAGEPDARVAEYRLYLLGRPPQTLQILKVARPLVGDLRAELAGEAALARDLRLRLEPRDEGRFDLAIDLPQSLPANVEPRLVLRGEEAAVASGLATITPGGYQLRALEFDQEGVTQLLIGDGADLVGLGFPEPVRVRSRARGTAAMIEIRPAPAQVSLQLDFRAERAAAGELAFAAQGAEQAGRLGEALALWDRLLAESPYERRLVDEAETARARLVTAGLVELEEVEREIERAAFFRLADLYRAARDQARAVAERYADSEVEARADALIAVVEASLADLEADLAREEIARLSSIHDLLAAQGSSSLASAVASYLEETYDADASSR